MVRKQTKIKGQAFSADILVVLVVVLFGVLFLVISTISQEEERDIQESVEASERDASLIVGELRTLGIIDESDSLDMSQLIDLDKDAIKEELDIEGEFAIVLEKDGNLVQIDAEQDINCVGSELITVNGVQCG